MQYDKTSATRRYQDRTVSVALTDTNMIGRGGLTNRLGDRSASRGGATVLCRLAAPMAPTLTASVRMRDQATAARWLR